MTDEETGSTSAIGEGEGKAKEEKNGDDNLSNHDDHDNDDGSLSSSSLFRLLRAKDRVSWGEAVQLLHRDRSTASYVDSETGLTALHLAVRYRQKTLRPFHRKRLVKTLLSVHPAAALIRCKDLGWTPLAHAVYAVLQGEEGLQEAAGIVKLLLEEHQEQDDNDDDAQEIHISEAIDLLSKSGRSALDLHIQSISALQYAHVRVVSDETTAATAAATDDKNTRNNTTSSHGVVGQSSIGRHVGGSNHRRSSLNNLSKHSIAGGGSAGSGSCGSISTTAMGFLAQPPTTTGTLLLRALVAATSDRGQLERALATLYRCNTMTVMNKVAEEEARARSNIKRFGRHTRSTPHTSNGFWLWDWVLIILRGIHARLQREQQRERLRRQQHVSDSLNGNSQHSTNSTKSSSEQAAPFYALHVLAQINDCPPPFVTLAMRANPSEVRVADRTTQNYPAHSVAAASKPTSTALITIMGDDEKINSSTCRRQMNLTSLRSEYPAAMERKNKQGRTPSDLLLEMVKGAEAESAIGLVEVESNNLL